MLLRFRLERVIIGRHSILISTRFKHSCLSWPARVRGDVATPVHRKITLCFDSVCKLLVRLRNYE